MKNIGYIYAIAASITWGLAYTLDQKVLEKFTPVSLMILSALLTLAVAVPVAAFSPEGLKGIVAGGKGHWGVLIVSMLLSAGASWLIFTSIKLLGAPTASIFEISYPFFVVFFSYLIFGTRITVPMMFGASLMFVGSYIVIRSS